KASLGDPRRDSRRLVEVDEAVVDTQRALVGNAPADARGVAADGAVGQRGSAEVDVDSVMVAGPLLFIPPPNAELLPEVVQPEIVMVPTLLWSPPPLIPAELPLTVQLVSVAVP